MARRTPPPPAPRPDIQATESPALSRALARAAERLRGRSAPDTRLAARARPAADLVARRASLVEAPSADPSGHERIIGESDLVSINYLDRGRRAAAAVCRIRVPSAGGAWFGTGCLVGPGLMMTNHHVLAGPDEAGQARIELGYEHDVDGVLRTPESFNLRPAELFFTDPVLDVTFVAVAPLAESGVPLERYGRLPLVPVTGKAVTGEWVTIIQHPNGGPKQISIRANQVVMLTAAEAPGVDVAAFIHYLTDTEPGSSGSPVLNDQWQVIALHHKAVPAPRTDPAAPIAWLANEGIRVSAIYRCLEERRFSSSHAAAVLTRLERALGLPGLIGGTAPKAEAATEADGAPYPASRWKAGPGLGYDADFLPRRIELAPIYAAQRKARQVAPLLDGKGHELDYRHFSVVVHGRRKFALLTAVNIDGARLRHPGERTSTWRRDARMAEQFQPAGNFYERKLGDDPVQFSRGHLVRRFDPSWGEDQATAALGDADTFHYTNAAPQFQRYNDTDWGNLEDYVLDRAQRTERRMTVFQGPIFREDDPLYGKRREGGPWRIPLSFWKIAVLHKDDGSIAAAAFINGQVQYVRALYEARVFSGLTPYSPEDLRSLKIQTTIATVEAETGLDFGAIRDLDSHGSLESTRRTRWLEGPGDILI